MKTRIRHSKSQIKRKTFLNYTKKKTKKKILNHKTKNRTLVVQKGGSEPTEFNKGDFKKLCVNKMTVLAPRDFSSAKKDCQEKYSSAENLFTAFNSANNHKFFLPLFSYHVGGSILYSAEPGQGAEPQPQGDKDLNNYYHCLRKTVRQLSNIKTHRKIFFLKAHSSYGKEYFVLPKNITVCFLTAVNKYGFTDFEGKKNIFSSYFGLADRKTFFNSLFAYHFNYFDKEEFYCERQSSYHIKMDYFRESTWYFPGQLCTNSGLQMDLEEYISISNTFGFTSVSESNYLETSEQDVIDNHFKKYQGINFNAYLKDILLSPMFEAHLNYIVILDGCRMFKYSDTKFNFDSQYNFIHYHITQKVCRDLMKNNPETTPFTPIPDYTVGARARNYFLKGVIINEDLEILKRKKTYNYFSFNNHLLHYLLEKLKDSYYHNDRFYHYFKWFAYTLDYDQMLFLYYKLVEKGDYTESMIHKIMNVEMLDYKFEMLIQMMDALLGQRPDEYTLFENFDAEIVVAMMNRTEKFRELLNILNQKEIQMSFNTRLPYFAGISFFNNNILFQKGDVIVDTCFENIKPYTLIVRVNSGIGIQEIISKLRSCVPQKRVSFYSCNFGSRNKNFKNKEIKHLMLVRCTGFVNTEINSQTKILEIHHLNNTMLGLFDAHQAETLIFNQIKSNALCIRGCVLTYLDLELKHGSTILPKFECPKLCVFKLRFERFCSVENFELGTCMYLHTLTLENINFSQNKIWDFNKFRMLKTLRLESFRFGNQIPRNIRNLEILSLKDVNNLQPHTLTTTITNAKNLKKLVLQNIEKFGEETDDLIHFLVTNRVEVILDSTMPRLSNINFY